jgi:acyl-CoA synthetase (AMP-forming)/AMP-acid ligase II
MTDKPGSVGVPVAASTAIVNRANLRPQPPGVEGEIAISGPTVLKKYLANPGADQKSYFFLSLPEDLSALPYFLTGDVGVIDGDGFLSLKGRAKELIKKGGEQVSPFEVEEPLLDHPWVQTPICFAVPSKLYGEEVGCALVLSLNAPGKDDPDLLRKVTAEMRAWMKEAKIAPVR